MTSPSSALVSAIQAHAEQLDTDEAFPVVDMALLHDAGWLRAPLPGPNELLTRLSLAGQGNLAVGRLFEAHINALVLLDAYAGPALRNTAHEAAARGEAIGLWVTDAGSPLQREEGRLLGAKGPCSGAGHVRHAVITVQEPDGTRLAWLTLDGAERVVSMRGRLPGMRAAVNGVVHLDGVALPDAAVFGRPGDYLREPLLSVGAWRTSAVTSGGLDALVHATRAELRRKRHDADVQQQARFGELVIAQHTARLWVDRAVRLGEDPALATADRVAAVNLARIAVEAACLDAIRLVQRGLGFSAFIRPNPVERLLRDLGVYLRQPAPDAVLTEAGQHELRRA